MVIEQKALVGKLKKFPSGIQQLFALSNNFRSSQESSNLFCPFGWMDNVNFYGETDSIDANRAGSKTRPLSQTYPQWKVMCDVQKLHSLQKRKRFKNRTMYILPLGSSDEKATIDSLINEHQQNGIPNHCSNMLGFVTKFTFLFFCGMEVKFLPFQDIKRLGFTVRVHSKTNREQVLVTDIIGYLKKIRPNDSFCIVGWSSLDLYPCSELNFVLGEACFDSGCAVVSFGHYADSTKVPDTNSGTEYDDDDLLNGASCVVNPCLSTAQLGECWSCTNLGDEVVWRVLKVLTHEVCHLLGMQHCTFFACLMNESSNVSEAQNQPLFLCPVCLRKLHKFLQFSIVSRYEMLKDFMELHCTSAAGKRQLSCHTQTDATQCHSPHLHTVDNNPNETSKYDTYTFAKFVNSSNWLDSVLKFIG